MNREETCLRGISRESEACFREKIAATYLSFPNLQVICCVTC